jgi:hypothetical protein
VRVRRGERRLLVQGPRDRAKAAHHCRESVSIYTAEKSFSYSTNVCSITRFILILVTPFFMLCIFSNNFMSDFIIILLI